MKNMLLLSFVFLLCLSTISCTFIYDSRNQNSLDALNPSYKLATADKVVLKTGRLIKFDLFRTSDYK